MPADDTSRRRRRRRRLLLLPVLAAAVLAALPWAGRALLWRWEDNPLLRGERLARKVGCLSCHRPEAGVEIPNPGSRWGTVPRFQAGNAMMYAESCADVEGFVRSGAPRAWLDDPEVRRRLASQRLRMPAYEGRLGDDEIADLVAYACAIEGLDLAGAGDPQVAAGRALARRHGCLSCHGVEGAGGRPNPGSLGGFIPGFAGRNFDDLVRDRAEFAEWIRHGTSRRLARNPLIRYFWQRQAIAMPPYGDALSDEEIDQLWAWVGAIRQRP